jgi:hypothetical protein
LEKIEEEKFVAEWLKEWMEKNRKHRTINEGRTLVCPVGIKMIDIETPERYQYCPLCGARLGNSTRDVNCNFIFGEGKLEGRLSPTEALLRFLDKEVENLPLQKEEEAEQAVNEIFEILELLEDPETIRDWVIRVSNEFNENPFVARALRFLRPQAFKRSEVPEGHGVGDEG